VREQRDNSANRNSLKSIFINIFLCIYTHRSGALVGDPDLVCARQEKEKYARAPRRKLSSLSKLYRALGAEGVFIVITVISAAAVCDN
jgi:hypothetical protein